jgi:luciferase family oxidoreductase group 1
MVTATPALGYRPAIWMLGSSDYGAHAAGVMGLPYSFAHHFAAANTMVAAQTYRQAFRPTGDLPEPYLMLGVSVVCADTDEEAQWLAAPGALAFLRLRSGRPGKYPTPEEAASHEYTPFERSMMEDRLRSQIIGSPATVRAGLAELAERTGADELMLTTMVHAHADRLRSYRLVAEATGLQRREVTPAGATSPTT